MLILPRRGIWAEQRGDNSDRGMQQWNGLETLLLKAGIDKEGMTEWNKSKKPYRNNGPLCRTNLNATQTVRSTTLSVYISTHPGVRIPPSVWHDFWLLSPHSKLPVLTERACYWGERQPDRRGSRRGEWGSVMLPERLPLPLCLLAESHHPSPIAHSTARAPKTPPSRLSAAHKPKSAGAFFTISGSLCWGGCCQSSPLIKGVKGEQQRYEEGGKEIKPSWVCCERISWGAALHCAVSKLASAGGRVV